MIKELNKNYKLKLIERFNENNELLKIIDNLGIIDVKYFNFRNEIKNGLIMCNKYIAEDLNYIFTRLYENKYQIEKIILIDEYEFDDIKSMIDNNSSCFNFRKILNKNEYSKHAYGLAIDINPLYNPYVLKNGEKIILPVNGAKYANRDLEFEHKIDHNDLCYKLFKERGFNWGGDWEYPDYQHFEKIDFL